MRLVLFGQGPLCEAVEAALSGHDIVAVYDSPQPTEVLRAAQAHVGLSAGYRHKLRKEEWECFPEGILNLHTGYLPWCKGAYPNIWPILKGEPAGVTIHRVDRGWDTGPIIAQVRVAVNPWDTAWTLYEKLLRRGVALLKALMDRNDGSFGVGTIQDIHEGSFHRSAEWDAERERMAALAPTDEMLRFLRAATFRKHPFCYRDTETGKLIEATITLKEVSE